MQIGGTKSRIAGGVGAGVGALASVFLGPALGALVGAGAGALTAVSLRLLFGKVKEAIFAKEILRDFAINVVDNKLLKQIKTIGENAFGKEADRKRFETLRLDPMQSPLLNYAQQTGQSAAQLPIWQRSFGKGITAESLSFDPSHGLPAFTNGGIVPGVDRGYDSVLSMLRPGELVVPKSRFTPAGGATTIKIDYIDARGSQDLSATARAVEKAVERGVEKALETGRVGFKSIDRAITRRVNRALSGDFGRRECSGT